MSVSESNTLSAAHAGSIVIGGDMKVNRLGLGAMRITGSGVWGPPVDREGALATLRRAVELGVNFIDTADSYGPYVSEELIAEALYPYPNDLVIATKGGWERVGPAQWLHNAGPKHLEEAVHGSLKRLKLERIDLYQLHVPDPAVSFDASMEALSRMRGEGKIRHIGLSNVTIEHVERAQRIVPVVSVQNRYSFSDQEWNYVLNYCESHGMAFMPWSPLTQNRKANDAVQKIAEAHRVSTAVVTLAWLLRRSTAMLPIPGTSRVLHLEDNVSAAAFHLDDAEYEELSAIVPPPFSFR